MVLVRLIAEAFCQWRSRYFPSRKPPRNAAHVLGQLGEDLAARYLGKHRYKILYRNFRGPRGGEVDIICRDKSCATLVFVEVKTRSSAHFGTPAQAVTTAKQRLIARGAIAWLRLLDEPRVQFRFDIVEVYMSGLRCSKINLIRNAFQLPEPYYY